MNGTMEYRNYIGSVEFSEADGLFYGEVQEVPALVSYEGKDLEELRNDFHAAVDDYLLWTEKKQGKDRKPLVLSNYAGRRTIEDACRQQATMAL